MADLAWTTPDTHSLLSWLAVPLTQSSATQCHCHAASLDTADRPTLHMMILESSETLCDLFKSGMIDGPTFDRCLSPRYHWTLAPSGISCDARTTLDTLSNCIKSDCTANHPCVSGASIDRIKMLRRSKSSSDRTPHQVSRGFRMCSTEFRGVMGTFFAEWNITPFLKLYTITFNQNNFVRRLTDPWVNTASGKIWFNYECSFMAFCQSDRVVTPPRTTTSGDHNNSKSLVMGIYGQSLIDDNRIISRWPSSSHRVWVPSTSYIHGDGEEISAGQLVVPWVSAHYVDLITYRSIRSPNYKLSLHEALVSSSEQVDKEFPS